MHKEADIQEVVESAFLPFKEVMEVSSDAVIYVVAMIEYYIYFGSIDRHTSYHPHNKLTCTPTIQGVCSHMKAMGLKEYSYLIGYQST